VGTAMAAVRGCALWVLLCAPPPSRLWRPCWPGAMSYKDTVCAGPNPSCRVEAWPVNLCAGPNPSCRVEAIAGQRKGGQQCSLLIAMM
jgi:hypothetical protein